MKDLCKIYGVSNITAKRIFQELKREGLISPVPRKGTVVIHNYKASEVVLVTKQEPYRQQENTNINRRIYNHLMEGLNSETERLNLQLLPISLKFFLSHQDNFKDREIIVMPEIFF